MWDWMEELEAYCGYDPVKIRIELRRMDGGLFSVYMDKREQAAAMRRKRGDK